MSTALIFAGDDYGIFVLARSILAKNPHAHLKFFFQTAGPSDAITESSLWEQVTPLAGVMYDHHRFDLTEVFCAHSLFPTQALHHLANEGLADSVEFRRLARKYLRRARQCQTQTLFFPEAIFAEPKTHQILQHLAGTQMQIQTLKPGNIKHKPTTDQRSITIYHTHRDITFLKKRAEKLLGTKLSETNFERVS